MSVWFAQHGFDLIQAALPAGGLLFAGYTFQKGEKAQRIANLIAIKQEHSDLWRVIYDHPELSRVLEKSVDLEKHPVTTQEWHFVKMLVLHLDTVRRAKNIDMFVKLQGLRMEVREFFNLPIPKSVWNSLKTFHDDDFTRFVESCSNSESQD